MDTKSSDGAPGATDASGPEAMRRLWSSWVEAASGSAPGTGQTGGAGNLPFEELVANDQVLRSIDQMWNANPLRDVVPVDWAEIAHALRYAIQVTRSLRC
jgi:polyhydroxyalkanoate synthase